MHSPSDKQEYLSKCFLLCYKVNKADALNFKKKKKHHHEEMHATRQWQEAGSVNISTSMLNKWMTWCVLYSLTRRMNVWKKKILVEANLLHIKAAACGRLSKSPCAIWSWVHVWLWYVMTTGEHLHTCLFSLWRLRCLSHTQHSFQIPQRNRSVKRRRKK